MTPRRPAFSLLETLLVVAIMATAIGFSVLFAQTDSVRTDLRTQSAIFVSYLREVQTDAASGKDGSATGIHLEADRYVLFKGAVYDPNDLANFEVELPAAIEITDIVLAGGGDEIIFSPPQGETAQSGTLTFSSDQIGQSVNVTITSLGTVYYE